MCPSANATASSSKWPSPTGPSATVFLPARAIRASPRCHDVLGGGSLGCGDVADAAECLWGEEEPKAVEPGWHLVRMAVQDARDHWEVVAPDGEHAAVVVAPLPLDGA